MREHNLRTGMGYGFSYSFIDFSGGVCEPPHRLQYVEKVKRLSRCVECHLTFLTGAIKSRYAHMCSNGTCARFNSKLVRIRSVRGAMNCATTSQEDKGFNSKLVRIRSVRGAMNCATTSQEDKGFNSKLVRLEASKHASPTNS